MTTPETLAIMTGDTLKVARELEPDGAVLFANSKGLGVRGYRRSGSYEWAAIDLRYLFPGDYFEFSINESHSCFSL